MTITLTQVAREAGVALSTASYALRGNPLINERTARVVRETANRLGYRPNAQVAALMTHIRAGRAVREAERIAFVRLDAFAPGSEHGMADAILAAARNRAREAGYGMDEFSLAEPGMSPRRLAAVLHARGISGVLLCPLPGRASLSLDWNWDWFATAVIGNTACDPELHHAGLDHYAAVRLAMRKLRESGARTIFGLLEGGINITAKEAVAAAFVEHHPEPARARRWLDLGYGCDTAMRRRLDKLRPDAVLTTWARWNAACTAGGPLSSGVRVALTDWRPNCEGLPGVDHCEAEIAASAVDLVVMQLQRNQLGPPAVPHMLSFPGIWREGVNRVAESVRPPVALCAGLSSAA